VLAEARRATGDLASYATHVAALASFEGRPVAAWVRDRAAQLTYANRETAHA
jgi:hypothetical protein